MYWCTCAWWKDNLSPSLYRQETEIYKYTLKAHGKQQLRNPSPFPLRAELALTLFSHWMPPRRVKTHWASRFMTREQVMFLKFNFFFATFASFSSFRYSLSFFLSWVANTQLNHWSNRVVSSRLKVFLFSFEFWKLQPITSDSRISGCPGLLTSYLCWWTR